MFALSPYVGNEGEHKVRPYKMPDVTIIGGGPAGNTAAILLARAGWDVTVLEQSRFPRDKVCGECLSALGFDVLTRLGLADEFLNLGAVRLDRCTTHASAKRSVTIRLPRPMWGLSRRSFDALLLDAARAAGATVRQPARCESLNASPRLTLTLRDLARNRVETCHPSHVILADGKAAFSPDAPAPTGDFGIKTHFTDVDGPRDTIELFGVRGSYGGLAAIENNLWNAAFSIPCTRLKSHRGNVESLFAEIMSENSMLRRRLERATRVGPWLASHLPRFAVRKQWPTNVIPVGNAAAALEPIGGEGMGLAMRSAELACESLVEAREDTPIPARRLRRAYQQLWRPRRVACRAAGIAASRSLLSNALLAMPVSRPMLKTALRLVGKS